MLSLLRQAREPRNEERTTESSVSPVIQSSSTARRATNRRFQFLLWYFAKLKAKIYANVDGDQ